MKTNVHDKFPRHVWVRKSELRCHRAYTSLEASTNDFRCSDGGWSKYLIGDENIIQRVLHLRGV